MGTGLRRIDPADAPGIFERVGLKPIREQWLGEDDGRGCACLLTALVADRFGVDAAIATAEGLEDYETTARACMVLAGKLGLPPLYALGIVVGWDGYTEEMTESLYHADHPDFDLGLVDGRAAARLCSPIGPQ